MRFGSAANEPTEPFGVAVAGRLLKLGGLCFTLHLSHTRFVDCRVALRRLHPKLILLILPHRFVVSVHERVFAIDAALLTDAALFGAGPHLLFDVGRNRTASAGRSLTESGRNIATSEQPEQSESARDASGDSLTTRGALV